jgi:hypothetical protein
MLQPPEQFSQLKALQWAAPLMAGALVFASIKSHGLASGDVLMWVTGATMVVAWVLAMLAVWRSTWGSRHQLVAVGSIFLLVVMPLATLLLPALSMPGAMSGTGLSGVVVLLLLGTLLMSAGYHAQRCPMPKADEAKVNWPPCKIDLAKQTLSVSVDPTASRFQPWPLASVGGVSVAIYHWLAGETSAQQMVLIGVVIALALSLWLCLVPLGRTLGQAWHLRALEAQRGVHVRSSRMPWLAQERQRYALGRWWNQP